MVVVELQRSVGRSARFACRGWRVSCAKVSRECPLLAFTRLANAHAAIATMFESVEAVPIAKVAALVAKAAASGWLIFKDMPRHLNNYKNLLLTRRRPLVPATLQSAA